jgi:AraC-like DNA-binding protein
MPSVLIINDHHVTLDTHSTVLRVAGFETATASNGRAGIELASSRAFDVHMVDLRLPDMSGIDVVRELKLRRVGGRVVIVTVFPAVESSFDAAAAGADGYVDGMLFGDEVVEVVTQALNGPFPVRHPSQRRAPESTEASHVAVASPSGIDSRVREVMRLIDADLAASHSIDELAARVGLSESGRRHLFHACTGLSVGSYRLERRLQQAARLIATTHHNIRQIAHCVGFGVGSLREFRKVFTERFGMSPTAYRAQFWRGLPPEN